MTDDRALEICKIIESNFGVVTDSDLDDLLIDLGTFKPEVRVIVRETLARAK
jgi:hypothetical protein